MQSMAIKKWIIKSQNKRLPAATDAPAVSCNNCSLKKAINRMKKNKIKVFSI
jgi:hypothetical protein